MITTIYGEMEEKSLEGPYRFQEDNDNQITETVEYRLLGRTVHRSTHVTLKKGLGIEGFLGNLRV